MVSAGLDSRVCLLDRRTQVDQITEVLPGAPVSSITCRDDGTSIVVGTTGERGGLPVHDLPAL